MAKIATAQIEIKPVLNEQALADVCRRIEDAVAGAIARGYARRPAPTPAYPWPYVTWSSGGLTTAGTSGATYVVNNVTDAQKPDDGAIAGVVA